MSLGVRCLLGKGENYTFCYTTYTSGSQRQLWAAFVRLLDADITNTKGMLTVVISFIPCLTLYIHKGPLLLEHLYEYFYSCFCINSVQPLTTALQGVYEYSVIAYVYSGIARYFKEILSCLV